MPTAITPPPTVSPRVQLTARQRACLEQIARRQTSPQRLVRRAKILLALETGATQSHVTRQMHLTRGTVHTWRQRWLVVLGRNNPSPYTVKGRPLYVHLNGLAIVLLK